MKILDGYVSTIRHCRVSRLLESYKKEEGKISGSPHFLIRQYADITNSLLTVVALAESPSSSHHSQNGNQKNTESNSFSLINIVGEQLEKLLTEVDILLKIMAAEISSIDEDEQQSKSGTTTNGQSQLKRFSFMILNLQYAIDVLTESLNKFNHDSGVRRNRRRSSANEPLQQHSTSQLAVVDTQIGQIFNSERERISEVMNSYIQKFNNVAIGSRFSGIQKCIQMIESFTQGDNGDNGEGATDNNDSKESTPSRPTGPSNVPDFMQTPDFIETLESTTVEFNSKWRQSLTSLIQDIQSNFPIESTSSLVLDRCLNQVLTDYQRFYETFTAVFNWQRRNQTGQNQPTPQSPATPTLRSQPIGVQTLIAELRKYR